MLSCYSCEHHYHNNNERYGFSVTMNGKLIKPNDRYCGYSGRGKKMVRIGKRDIPKKRLHPAWCPRYKERTSCMLCGKTIYGDQIECLVCKRKGGKTL